MATAGSSNSNRYASTNKEAKLFFGLIQKLKTISGPKSTHQLAKLGVAMATIMFSGLQPLLLQHFYTAMLWYVACNPSLLLICFCFK